MARRKDDEPRKRFSKSGHTTHRPRGLPPDLPPPGVADAPTQQHPAAPPPYDPPPYDPPPYDRPGYQPPPYQASPTTRPYPPSAPPGYQPPPEPRGYRPPPDPYRRPPHRYDDGYDERYPDQDADTHVQRRVPRYDERYDERYADRYDERYADRYDERYPGNHDERYPAGYDDRRRDPYARPPAGYYAPPGSADPNYDATTVHPPAEPQPQTVGRAALTLGKSTLSGTNRAARVVTRKVIAASKADGADRSGLTALIWNQVLSYGTDAMVTVALAGTVFFGASANAQRGNVLLYLAVTMAPFALVAPVIGPALDRLQHGRRWTMAGTAIGRCILALVMAGHPTDLLVLYPCALGSLVLSKAYGVVRAAAAPRLVPPGMTLTTANSKLTIFGLGSTLVLGGLVGAIIKVTGSYSLGLIVTAIGFGACAYFAFSLPPQVDSANAARRHPEEPARPRRQEKVPTMSRIHGWARRGFDAHVVLALQGESALRLLSGMLTIYLAFFVESTKHGFPGVAELGGVVAAAGAGNFVGTAIGTRLKMGKPEFFIAISTCIAAATCLVTAFTFNIFFAIIGFFLVSVMNALSKIALDSLIQNDVVETLRSSAFARSETFLQLAWVIGAALGVILPSHSSGDGMIAFIVAGVISGAVAVVITLRMRAAGRTATPYVSQAPPLAPQQAPPHEPPAPPGRYPHPGSVAPRSFD